MKKVTLIVFSGEELVPGMEDIGPVRKFVPGALTQSNPLSPKVKAPEAVRDGGDIVVGRRRYVLASGVIRSYEVED